MQHARHFRLEELPLGRFGSDLRRIFIVEV
jgi:hypothetical protein